MSPLWASTTPAGSYWRGSSGASIYLLKIVIGQQTGTSFLLVYPGGEMKVFEHIGTSEAVEPGDIPYGLLKGFSLLHTTMYRLEAARRSVFDSAPEGRDVRYALRFANAVGR